MAFSSSSGSSSGYSSGLSQSAPVINPGAAGFYNQLLGLNRQNYQSVLDSYSSGIRNAQGQLPGIYNAYGGLEKQVMGTLGLTGGGWGVATPAAQAIQRTFEQQNANSQQQLVNAGLGNTTILSGVQGQNARQAAEAYGGLGAQLAQTAAGYQSQFGLAQQQARMQGLGMQTGLASQLGSTLGGYRFANTFGNLYGQQSTSSNQSRQASSNVGSSYSPSGGGGYGGSSSGGAGGQSPYGNFGLNASQMFAGNYTGAAPSYYYPGTAYQPAGMPQGAQDYGGGYGGGGYGGGVDYSNLDDTQGIY
jgi:hypothetical protein